MVKPKTKIQTRVESDSLGTVEVPANVYWGAQTARSLIHFNIGRDTMPPELIRAFGILKKAAALVNADLGQLLPENARLIAQAADEIIAGKGSKSWRWSPAVCRHSRERARPPPHVPDS